MNNWIETKNFVLYTDGRLFCKDSHKEMLKIPSEINGVKVIHVSGDNIYSNLKTLIIDEGIETIRGFYKESNPNLENVKMANSVNHICAFHNTPFIKNHKDENGLSICDDILYDAKDTSGNIVIPKNIRFVASQAFENSTISSIEFSENVKIIDDYVFADCLNLTSVILPRNLLKISNGLFQGCNFLKEIDIPDSVTEIGFAAFRNCENLKEIKNMREIETIYDCAFENCTSLQNINFSSSLKTIKSFAFFNCIALKQIAIPNSVTELEEGAFKKCTNIDNIKLSNQIKKISKQLFLDCNRLTSIVLPNTIEIIEKNAFQNCTSLKDIIFEKNSSLTLIEDSAFQNTSLENIDNFPESIVRIGEKAFAGCKKIKTANLPNSLIHISFSLFKGCSKLISAKIPEKIYTFPFSAFEYCNSLEELYVPNAQSFIPCRNAGYKNLKAISFPLDKIIDFSYSPFQSFFNNPNCKLKIRCTKDDFVRQISTSKFLLSKKDIIFTKDIENALGYIESDNADIFSAYIECFSPANIIELQNQINARMYDENNLNEKLKLLNYQQIITNLNPVYESDKENER